VRGHPRSKPWSFKIYEEYPGVKNLNSKVIEKNESIYKKTVTLNERFYFNRNFHPVKGKINVVFLSRIHDET
jgi:hypothetical protein